MYQIFDVFLKWVLKLKQFRNMDDEKYLGKSHLQCVKWDYFE